MYPHKSRLALLALMLAFFSVSSFAQTAGGTLTGTVYDASGATVPGATVTAKNTATNVESTTTSTGNGQYRIPNLLVGTYDLTVTASGFTKASVTNFTVELNKTATANITLEVGTAATTVDVSAASATIDTTTAQIQNNYTSRMTQDLPIASFGAGVVNLSLLGSGVSSAGGIDLGSGPSVGGQRPRNNNFTIEGTDNNQKSTTGSLLFVPNDAVSEFSVLQNQFAADFGHSNGGQFNTVVVSGTNEFHGRLYDYLQNRNFQAMDQISKNNLLSEQPRYDQNRLGGQIGGPILRNKLFFFANFEYNPVGQATSPSSVTFTPTAEGYASLANIPGINQTNLDVFRQFATPAPTASGPGVTVAGVNIPTGVLPIAAPNFQNNYYGVFSTDYNISDKDQLRGRYVYNKQDLIDTKANLPVFYATQPNRSYLVNLAEFHNFSPTLINELRVGYNRFNQQFPVGDFTFPGLNAFPNLEFQDLALQIGPDSDAPQFTIQNLYQGSDTLTWMKGNHTLKGGYEFRKSIAPSTFIQRVRGDYGYSTLENYLLDRTPDVLAERSLGDTPYYGDQIAHYGFVNDSWKIRSNFTLNLGVRYEYTGVSASDKLQVLNAVSDVPGLLTFGVPKAQKTNFMPRIGFAYSPGTSGNTSIRGGFGMGYDVNYDNLGILSLPPQLVTTVNCTGQSTGNFLANGGLSTPGQCATSGEDIRSQTSAYIADQKLPRAINWNFGIQRVFAHDYTFEARYLGTRGVHLPIQTWLNGATIVNQNRFIPTYLTNPGAATLSTLPLTVGDLQNDLDSGGFIQPRFFNAGFTGPITQFAPIGNSIYHGLALQLDRRFSNGLTFRAAYTWSHAIDDSSPDVFSTDLTPRRAQDFQGMRAERSSSAYDRRHRLTLFAVYDLPFFKNRNWFMKNLVGNWEITPIYTYESPQYATTRSATDSNMNGDTAGDRAILNPNGIGNTGSDVQGLDRTGAITTDPSQIVAWVANDPTAKYIRAQTGAISTAGRNTLPIRPINNVDATFLKRISISERYKVEFAGQFYNLFNHAQFIPGFINNTGPLTFSTSGPAIVNYLTPGNPIFNNPEAVFSSNPRNIQLVMKFIF